MRKQYLDNLRLMVVLFLIPYHTFVFYIYFDFDFYLRGAKVLSTTVLMMLYSPWAMSLLFVVSGISSYYALQKRSNAEYVKERLTKLLIPFIFGITLVMPVASYYTDRFHNGYSGSFFQYFSRLFSNSPEITETIVEFAVGPTWFLGVLFLISIITLPIMRKYLNSSKRLHLDKVPLIVLILLFIFPLVGGQVFHFVDKMPIAYLFEVLLGFFVFSDESVLEKVGKYRFLLSAISVVGLISLVVITFLGPVDPDIGMNILSNPGTLNVILTIYFHFVAWISILALLGMGKNYMNISNKVTKYLSESSFTIYLFHMSWLVAIGYYVLRYISSVPLQIISMIVLTTIASFVSYEILKRFSVTRFMFGIKAPKRKAKE